WLNGSKRTRPQTDDRTGRIGQRRVVRAARPRLRLEALEERAVPANWTALGPAPITGGALGAGSNQPFTGRIAALAADPTDANTIYIAAAGGGVWKTTNGGTAWTPLTDTQSTLFMGSMAVMAPAGADLNHRVVYAGTG